MQYTTNPVPKYQEMESEAAVSAVVISSTPVEMIDQTSASEPAIEDSLGPVAIDDHETVTDTQDQDTQNTQDTAVQDTNTQDNKSVFRNLQIDTNLVQDTHQDHVETTDTRPPLKPRRGIKRCRHEYCNCVFNHPGEKFCQKTEFPEFVDRKENVCQHAGCLARALFNNPGKKTGKFCNYHKLEGMVNIKRMRTVARINDPRVRMGTYFKVISEAPEDYNKTLQVTHSFDVKQSLFVALFFSVICYLFVFSVC